MAESTLALDIDALRIEAATVLGVNRTYASLSTLDAQDVDRAVESGYRMFLWPESAPDPDVQGKMVVHRWRFLRISYGTIAMTADDYTDDLPDDFGWIIGPFITIDDDAESYRPIVWRSESDVLRLRQHDSDTTTVPFAFAIRPKAFDGTTGCRHEIVWYPTPDDAYDVTFPYAPIPDKMVSGAADHPWGGAQHAETVKAAVRAAAEMLRAGAPGAEYGTYVRRLTASIKTDRQLTPRTLGTNYHTQYRARHGVVHGGNPTYVP